MGISGISPLSLLLILIIVLVLFGAKRLKHLGRDLGMAIKNFRQATETDESSTKPSDERSE